MGIEICEIGALQFSYRIYVPFGLLYVICFACSEFSATCLFAGLIMNVNETVMPSSTTNTFGLEIEGKLLKRCEETVYFGQIITNQSKIGAWNTSSRVLSKLIKIVKFLTVALFRLYCMVPKSGHCELAKLTKFKMMMTIYCLLQYSHGPALLCYICLAVNNTQIMNCSSLNHFCTLPNLNLFLSMIKISFSLLIVEVKVAAEKFECSYITACPIKSNWTYVHFAIW